MIVLSDEEIDSVITKIEEEGLVVTVPGDLVSFRNDFADRLRSHIIVNDTHFDIDESVRNTPLKPNAVGVVIAVTDVVWIGRPAWRGHYVITPDAMGWYTNNPTKLEAQ